MVTPLLPSFPAARSNQSSAPYGAFVYKRNINELLESTPTYFLLKFSSVAINVWYLKQLIRFPWRSYNLVSLNECVNTFFPCFFAFIPHICRVTVKTTKMLFHTHWNSLQIYSQTLLAQKDYLIFDIQCFLCDKLSIRVSWQSCNLIIRHSCFMSCVTWTHQQDERWQCAISNNRTCML